MIEGFSLENLRRILQRVKETGRLCDFADAEEDFIVLRHDVEFSLDKAVEVARIEHEMGIEATYFVQVGNESYNPFSDRSKAIIDEIRGYGHKIGLHYRWGEHPYEEIVRQSKFLEWAIGARIDRYSTHRPQAWQNYEENLVPGMINAYGSRFFERTDHPETARVKYMSDSRYTWRFGFPDEENLKAKRVQILIHPFQWESESIEDCFGRLLRIAEENNRENYKREFFE